jgi:hypothetical protein
MLTVGMYKTRDGRDVKIVAVEDRIAIGYSVKEGINSLTTWNANNGRYFIDGDYHHKNDLIDTKPRIKMEAWATIYEESHAVVFAGGVYSTKEQALENMQEACIAIARVPIDCVRGENLT